MQLADDGPALLPLLVWLILEVLDGDHQEDVLDFIDVGERIPIEIIREIVEEKKSTKALHAEVHDLIQEELIENS
jgi:hypothetical protein